jgi:hypothetical protein
MTVDEIDAAIASLEAAKLAKLTGRQLASSNFPDTGGVTFSTSTVGEINREIARLRIERSKITGEPAGYGPFVPGFGGRP